MGVGGGVGSAGVVAVGDTGGAVGAPATGSEVGMAGAAVVGSAVGVGAAKGAQLFKSGEITTAPPAMIVLRQNWRRFMGSIIKSQL